MLLRAASINEVATLGDGYERPTPKPTPRPIKEQGATGGNL